MRKKKGFRKIICAGLVAVMVAGLCGCGGDDAVANANAALAKEYVYGYEEIVLPDAGENGDITINSVTRYDGRIYMAVNIYQWSSDAGNSEEVKLISIKEDGTDMQTVELDFSQMETGKNEEASEEIAAGNLARIENAVMEPVLDDAFGVDMDMALDEDYYSQSYESNYYNNYIIGQNGTVYAVRNHYYEDYSDPENYVYENNQYICAWDLKGTFLWQCPIEGLENEESYSYISKLIPGKDGAIDILISGDKQQVRSIDANGNSLGERELKNGAEVFVNVSDIMVKADGSLLVTYYGEDWSKLYMVDYDIATDTLGEASEMPESLMWSGYGCMAPGVTSDIVYATGSGVFALNRGDETPTQIMSYINSDINTTNMNNLIMLDENHFIGFYYDRSDNENKGAFFTKKNPEDIPDKQVLVLAGAYIPYELTIRVVNYNKSNDKYRIVVKEYESYNTMEDYTASYTMLNNDIVAGNMPDILVADTMLPIDNYIAKGLIADVGELMEQDEELSQIEYLQNVFDAYSLDEKLYYIIPHFYVQTWVGKTSILGDREGWTMEEFQEFAKTVPEGTNVISDLTRSYFMNMVMQYSGNDFIDLATGKCNFDSPEFIGILEYAKTLPAELSEDYYDDDYWMNYESQYREDRTVLMTNHIAYMSDMNTTMNGYFGEDVNFIGFPTATRDGAVVMAGESYVISAKSKNIEGAWDFMRYYLTPEYQKTMEWGLPVIRSIFEENAKKALEKPYWINEDGEKEEYDNYFTINGENIVLEPLNQEQLDQVIDVVTSANRKYYYNTDVQNIITEEVAAFFEGQKSAQDVAQIIQSRIQIYVDENR